MASATTATYSAPAPLLHPPGTSTHHVIHSRRASGQSPQASAHDHAHACSFPSFRQASRRCKTTLRPSGNRVQPQPHLWLCCMLTAPRLVCHGKPRPSPRIMAAVKPQQSWLEGGPSARIRTVIDSREQPPASPRSSHTLAHKLRWHHAEDNTSSHSVTRQQLTA